MTDENERDIRISKKLSYLLRHGAEKERVLMDGNGWVLLDDVLRWFNQKRGDRVDLADIERVVATNAKQRFAISGQKIRA
nr:RNA 2'-phosphotransferase [Candidatus Sigynarchaeota archaeon]